jgi:hypothetical protein
VKKHILFIFYSFIIVSIVFGQSSPDVLIDRNGRAITSIFTQGRRTIIAPVFLSDEVCVNFEYTNGRVIAAILFTGDHFTDIDSFDMLVTADREIQKYSEKFNSIIISAEKRTSSIGGGYRQPFIV